MRTNFLANARIQRQQKKPESTEQKVRIVEVYGNYAIAEYGGKRYKAFYDEVLDCYIFDKDTDECSPDFTLAKPCKPPMKKD